MATQSLSSRVLLITLPREPQSGSELEMAAHTARRGPDRDVIVDFSLVEAMPAGTICNLIILQRLLNAASRQLVLCSVPPPIVITFKRVGLRKLFRFATDEFTALQSLDD
jgi:anti-anti-sigma regulatory factor